MTTAAITFAVIFLAELPDKTALAALVLGARFRPLYVFTGVAAAFAVHVVIAVAAGQALSLLPRRWVELVVGLLFLAGAAMLLLHKAEGTDEERETDEARTGFRPVALMSFSVVLVAEFGDLTQITTANLAAKYHDPVAVGLGAVLALWAVAGVAIVGGRNLLKVLPLTWITRAAAAFMLVLAVVTLVEAARG